MSGGYAPYPPAGPPPAYGQAPPYPYGQPNGPVVPGYAPAPMAQPYGVVPPNRPAYGAQPPSAPYPAAPGQIPFPPPGQNPGQPPRPGPTVATRNPPITSSPSLCMPTSTLEVSIRCEHLSNQDMLSKSDPFCVMFLQTKAGNQEHWTEVGRTETIKDDLNPEWQHKFVVNYSFEERQVVRFEIFDSDSNSRRLEDHDFLGRCETTLGTIVSSGKHYAAVLQDAPFGSKGKAFIYAEELEVNKEVIKMQLAAKNLDKKDFFGKSDPFFVISKATSSGKHVVVKKSEVIMSNLNPVWNPFTISVRDLCNNNEDRQLKFDVYDWNNDGSRDFIGTFNTDLKTLKTAAIEQKMFPLINEKKLSKKKYKNSGELYVKNISVEQELSFVDYIKGGTAMNFSVAVDFTASNGHPQDRRSLHYLDPNFGDNQYTTAIKAVGSIIEDYDTDKMFPALGFGARVPPTNQVSHEFFLNLRQDNPYCERVDGLLQAYYTALRSVTLYGPTNFAPVIKHVTRFASAYQDGSQYFVLLIITDGIITDLEATKHAIIDACDLPLSIIIVGVGNEDFQTMEELDSDDRALTIGSRKAKRDIVQFVEMRRFVNRGYWDKELLAKDVLAEIPKQMVGWMKSRGIKPKNPS